MRQYELAIRIAQIHHLVDERKYKKALAVIQTIDVKQVRSISDLKVFAEVYAKTEQYNAAKEMYLRICQSSKTRRVLYRLVYLSIRTNSLEDAEAYYKEYMQMNPSTRDALILRYRIDKAAGVPIGNLIALLQELKQEEYIEEWAYELAKLYHRAGRREECMEECKDIMLWFGSGEIVERAKILLDHLKEKDPIPYYDDKDFTMPKKEAPNPDDTGSLPDLNEFIKERKALKREERKADRVSRKTESDYEEGYNEEAAYSREEEEIRKKPKEQPESDTEFIDDYEEDDFENVMMFPHAAKGGIHKLSGLLRFGRKEEDKAEREELPEQKKGKSWSEEREKKETEQGEEISELEIKVNENWQGLPEQEQKETKQKKGIPERETKRIEVSVKKKETSERAKERLLREKEASERERERLQWEKEKEKESLPQREEEGQSSVVSQETAQIEKEIPKKKKVEYVPHSQSGTGITQDLAKEIAAIYEMEQKGQLKEKSVAVIEEKESTEKDGQTLEKQQMPKKERALEKQQVSDKERMPEKKQVPVRERVSEKQQAAKKKQSTVSITKPIKRIRTAGETKDKTNIAANLVERMTQAVQKSTSRSYIPINVEEIQRNVKKMAPVENPVPPQKVQVKETAVKRQKMNLETTGQVEKHIEVKVGNEEDLRNLLEEKIEDPEKLQELSAKEETGDLEKLPDQEKPPENLEEVDELPDAEKAQGEAEKVDGLPEPAESQEETEEVGELQELAESQEETEEVGELQELAESQEEAEEVDGLPEPTESQEEAEEVDELPEPVESRKKTEEVDELQEPEEPQEVLEEAGGLPEAEEAQEEIEGAEDLPEIEGSVEGVDDESGGSTELNEEVKTMEESLEEGETMDEETPEKREKTKDLTETAQAVKRASSGLQDYQAPKIPVVETSYTSMPQITYEDLPTTRALQQSFKDVLYLIEGELDPSHFVLMGDGTERIVGVSKKIVHVMKESNYLSEGRIAKISASQLNKMDLISFRKQLKGNCLLIEEASDLLFPTITKIFSIMEEYAGDFVVILSDEGTTLDQLFRFVPVLAKRFKYIIDITKYTEKDYM